MQITDRISISPPGGPDSDEPAKSRLIIDGNAFGTVVAGSYFEAAVETEDFYLLFLTNCNPFEDFLNSHMLDKRGKVIDSCSLGEPYSTGSFSLLQLDGTQRSGLPFRFIGGTVWHLEVFAAHRFRWPFVSEPFGVRRTRAFHFNFRLQGQPVPETQNL